jgi:acetylornithine/N-succinyldiaminopimelate aminotransferase
MSILKVYNPVDIEVDHGDGVYLYSADGTRYLDFTSGIGVMCLGHSHPALVNELKKQGEKVWHCSNLFKIKSQKVVADKLVSNSFASNVFFCNSGSEATEASIKIARKYFYEKGQKKKNRIITFEGAFHGRTLAALYAANNPLHIEGFGPKIDGFDQVPFGDHDALEKAITKDTAAIMVETIFGEGGIRVLPNECLIGLRKLCDEKDILLILDEVQCGIARTGKFFAFEWAKIKPDIVPIAKGIGGGFPIGACLVNKKTANAMKPGSHGSTFGGNPLAMAISSVVLDYVLNKDFLKNVISIGEYLRDMLNENIIKKFPNLVIGLRGKGLMLGIEAKVENQVLINEMMNEKLLTVKASQNVIRLLPPLILEEKHVDEAIKKIDRAFRKL